MKPLVKQTAEVIGLKYWIFQVSGRFYGLNFNPLAFIYHGRNSVIYKAVINYHDKSISENFFSFRSAFDYLIKNTVEKYYKTMPDPRIPTREEMAEMQKLK